MLFSLQKLDSCYVILTSVIMKNKAAIRHWVDVIALQKLALISVNSENIINIINFIQPIINWLERNDKVLLFHY